jgi:hypothetical protein
MGAVSFVIPLVLSLLAEGPAALLEALRSPDPEIRLEAVRGLGPVAGEEVSAALAGALADPEASVRGAALTALGGRRDTPSLAALRSSLRLFAKEPELLAAAVTSLGASEDAASAEEVAKLARQAATADPRLVRACLDALGRLRAREAVDCLVSFLGGALASEARESLADLTELPFSGDDTWGKWWRQARADWRPLPLVPAPDATEYRSESWRFRIAVPDAERFPITRPAGSAARVLYRGPKEEAGFAWVDVLTHAVLEGEPRTLEEQSARVRRTMEQSLRETKDAEYGKSARFAGVKAFRHEATGILSDGRVARWRNLVLERNGILYTISAGLETGASDRVRRDHEAILASFRLLD